MIPSRPDRLSGGASGGCLPTHCAGVEPFTSGTTAPVNVTATKTDPTRGTSWEFKARDMAGNVTHCV